MLGNLNRSAPLNIGNGHLIVKGNVTLSEAGTVSGGGTLSVSGGLTSTVVDTGTGPVLVAGPLTARQINTAGGNFGAPVTIKTPSDESVFGGTRTIFTSTLTANGPVEFTGAGSFGAAADIKGYATFGKEAVFTATGTFSTAGAEFKDDVTFGGATDIKGAARFASGKTVLGEVTVGMLVVGGVDPGSGTLLLGPGGQIIYNYFPNSVLNGAGTLATLDGAGTVTFGFSASELAVSGAGSFVVNNSINLTSGNTITLDGSAGIFFNGGSIDAVTYTLGATAGTLTSSEALIIGVGSISGSQASPAIKLSGALLNVKNGSLATISSANIDLASAGSVTFGPSATLLLSTGGSVTTAGGSLAQGGYIVSEAGGSIVSGSESGYNNVDAGSIGTIGNAFILPTSDFVSVAGSSAATAAGSAASNPNENAGTIAVFTLP